MAADDRAAAGQPSVQHGQRTLPGLTITSYSAELRDDEGLVGDRASQTAFREMLDTWRGAFRAAGKDPLGTQPTESLDKARLDRLLALDNAGSETIAAAMEEWAQQFARVVRAFRALPAWRGVERIVVGGGFQQSAVGEQAIARSAEILAAEGHAIPISTLRQHADEGALIGWVHLAPLAMQQPGQAFLAVDIGGTNVRCGIVEPRRDQAADGSAAQVLQREKWHHAADGVTREAFVDGVAGMLRALATQAGRDGLRLAPFVGIACPGVIEPDGSIAAGAQNLPGDWENGFHLPAAIAAALADGSTPPPQVLLHNDAVVQGLGEWPHMRSARAWAVLTVGTGLGNASYVNSPAAAGVARG